MQEQPDASLPVPPTPLCLDTLDEFKRFFWQPGELGVWDRRQADGQQAGVPGPGRLPFASADR